MLLDFLRRELAIKVDYLDARTRRGCEQRLEPAAPAPWALDENEQLEYAAVALPAPRRGGDEYRGNVTSRRAAASGSSLPAENARAH